MTSNFAVLHQNFFSLGVNSHDSGLIMGAEMSRCNEFNDALIFLRIEENFFFLPAEILSPLAGITFKSEINLENQ